MDATTHIDSPVAIGFTINVSDAFCADVLCTALEGGIGYWSVADQIKQAESGDYVSAVLEDAEGDENWKHTIDYAAIRRGIKRALEPDFNLNRDTKGYIFSAITQQDAGQIDADAADAIVQAACFNTLVYG
jgi:hypothetical protein